MSWETWVLLQQDSETLCCPKAILRGMEPVSGLFLLFFVCDDLALTGF